MRETDQGRQLRDEVFDAFYSGVPVGLILGRHQLQIGKPVDFKITDATEEFIIVNMRKLRDSVGSSGQFPLRDGGGEENTVSFGANVVASRLGFGVDRFPVAIKRVGDRITIRDFGGPGSPPTIVVTPIQE